MSTKLLHIKLTHIEQFLVAVLTHKEYLDCNFVVGLYHQIGDECLFSICKHNKIESIAADALTNCIKDKSLTDNWLTSYDEINKLIDSYMAELWNVFKGEMNLVGPRPLLAEYLPLYSERQSRRHEVKPGITGWAQINGRNSISWEDRLEMDVWYVENRSLWLDIKILWKTVFRVFKRDGINQDDHATMPYFSGNQNKGNDA